MIGIKLISILKIREYYFKLKLYWYIIGLNWHRIIKHVLCVILYSFTYCSNSFEIVSQLKLRRTLQLFGKSVMRLPHKIQQDYLQQQTGFFFSCTYVVNSTEIIFQQ